MHINWNLGLQQFALPFPSLSSYIPSRRAITFNSTLSCSFCFLSLSWFSLYSSAGISGSAAARFLSAINGPTDGTSVYFSVVISTLLTLSLLHGRGRWSLKKRSFSSHVQVNKVFFSSFYSKGKTYGVELTIELTTMNYFGIAVSNQE